MRYLNLTKGFDPFNSIKHETDITFKIITFFGGEPHIKITLSDRVVIEDVMITQRIKSFNDFGELAVAVDALRRLYNIKSIKLFLPYFPGARQDAIRSSGEALTVKVYADLINSLGFDKVIIFDPHSSVTYPLIDNCIVENNHYFINRVIQDIIEIPHKKIAIVCPDAGAQKKIYDLLNFLDNKFLLIKCDKHRDPITQEVSGFRVYDEIPPGYDCLIVDDICDGGRTFMRIATKLKDAGANDIYLAISHGLFSYGFKELAKYFKKIYTTDSWYTNISMELPEIEKKSEIVTIIPFNKLK